MYDAYADATISDMKEGSMSKPCQCEAEAGDNALGEDLSETTAPDAANEFADNPMTQAVMAVLIAVIVTM